MGGIEENRGCRTDNQAGSGNTCSVLELFSSLFCFPLRNHAPHSPYSLLDVIHYHIFGPLENIAAFFVVVGKQY